MKAYQNKEEVKKFIEDHLNDDPAELMLSAHKYPELDMKFIVGQIASRQQIRKKLSDWYENFDLVLPPKENLEQASSEITAKFKSRWVKGGRFADVTGGTGIDCYYLSEQFEKSVYVEKNEDLAETAAHNFEVLGREIQTKITSAEEFLEHIDEPLDWIFIDPSRRDDAKNRVFALEDCEPNILELKDTLLEKSEQVLIKVSPMLDIKKTLEQLQRCYRVQIVAVDNEVKEMLLYLNNDISKEPEIEAWNLLNGGQEEEFCFSLEDEEQSAAEFGEPENYLYEPNAALMKAGAYNLISVRHEVRKLHSNTHLYTSEELVESFPGKRLRILEVSGASKKEVKKLIPQSTINVISRNFPMGATEIKKKYKLRDGGDQFLIFCETISRFKAILAEWA